MLRKSIYFYLLGASFFLFMSVSYADGESCEYTTEIEQCEKENKDGSPRSIKDFVCLTTNDSEKRVYQIVLDKEFSKIDDEVEIYLDGLESDKDRYFGANKERTYIQAIDDIIELFSEKGVFWNKYSELCGTNIVSQVQTCQGGATSISRSIDFFAQSKCMALSQVKLDIYKQVAFDILILNKVQVRKDAIKKYVIEERKKYNILLDIMMVNIGYIERILKKWPAKLKNPY